jgi:nitrous oxide reductase accessory protein NosL
MPIACPPTRLEVLLVVFALTLTLGCPADDGGGAAAQEPVALTDQEDVVCGMLVRAQSAPRSQVVHRDGTRVFVCSLGDLLVHLSAPSPHGAPQAVFVEVMDPSEDPMKAHLEEHPWIPAEQAFYVVGIERRGIMGAPVLTYATRAEAEAAMQGHARAELLDFAGLKTWWQAEQAAH